MQVRLPQRRSVLPCIIVLIATTIYFFIFSFMSIRRVHVLWASYFDLGIMHQTVYNTYQGLQTLDTSRLLELTDPHESGKQINRIAIHNDMLLLAIAPLYFIHAGPETLLVLQAFVLASGALALFGIVKIKTRSWPADKSHLSTALSIFLPICYLLYYPMNRTNLYEFHAVTLATGLILWMYLAYMQRKWAICALLCVGILLSKEHSGFSLGVFFLVEALYARTRHIWSSKRVKQEIATYLQSAKTQMLFILGLGMFVFVLFSVFFVIPAFRSGSEHFALNYFASVEGNILTKITTYMSTVLSWGSTRYIFDLIVPLIFTPVLSVYFLPATPDILMNILSSNPLMKSTFFQYTAIITPWLFIAASESLCRILPRVSPIVRKISVTLLFGSIVVTSYLYGPLPYARNQDLRLWYENPVARRDILLWQEILKDERIRVSSTGQLSPYLTSRRYFYDFGANYDHAEYVLIQQKEIEGHWIKGKLIPYYDKLIHDERYKQIYNNNGIEVYKRMPEVN